MDGAGYSHEPVMADQCLEALAVRPDGVYVDATLGAGGHAARICGRLLGGKLIGIDRDPSAVRLAAGKLVSWQEKSILLHGNYRDMEGLLGGIGIKRADGILFDLGVSSPQLDDPSRGFSYRYDTPLDMRMDPDDPASAFDVVNHWPIADIRRILYDYGEERHAHLIAAAIGKKRLNMPILTTGQLASLIVSALPPAVRRGKGHPAKRSFQAIRMAVNDELACIAAGLSAAVRLLGSGGRLAVLSFHSVEDRVVKTAFRDLSHGCDCPPGFPACVCGKAPVIKQVYRKPIFPSAEEMARNRRSHSAKLRAAEKLPTRT